MPNLPTRSVLSMQSAAAGHVGGQAACGHEALLEAGRLARTGWPERAFSRALAVHEQARAEQQSQAARTLEARSGGLLACCCLMMASYETGIGFARAARALWEARGDKGRAARVAATLAWLQSAIGEPDAAEQALAALAQAEAAADREATIAALNASGVVFWMLRQPERALPFSREAVARSAARGRPCTLALINLAGVEMEIALHDQAGLEEAATGAIATTARALAQARADGNGWAERLAVCNIAEYQLHLGSWNEAARTLAEHRATAGEPTDRCRAHYLHMLGRTRIGQGGAEAGAAGQATMRAAIATLDQCRTIAMRCQDLETASACHRDLAEAYARLGAHEDALRAHRIFHALYVRQASEDAQRRARTHAGLWEAEQLRTLAREARERAHDLARTNRRLSQETERLIQASFEDPLTGLQNRRRLDLAFLELLEAPRPFALAMIDVDHFKQVNDRFSHLVGDSVLRAIAEILSAETSPHDLIVRFGGEEFAMLLRTNEAARPPALAAAAASICERLRARIAGHAWSRLAPALSVTVSVGLATSQEAPTHTQLMALADARLYAAKQAGRNRVVSDDGAHAPALDHAPNQTRHHAPAPAAAPPWPVPPPQPCLPQARLPQARLPQARLPQPGLTG